MTKFIIKGRLPSLNEYVEACRSSKYKASSIKKQIDTTIAYQLPHTRLEGLYDYCFIWTEPDKRRDHDNIASAAKFIFDAMQQKRIIRNDGWKNVGNILHIFVHEKGAEYSVEVQATYRG